LYPSFFKEHKKAPGRRKPGAFVVSGETPETTSEIRLWQADKE
jgi:hypothetical protein